MGHTTIPDPTDLPDLDADLREAIDEGNEQAVRGFAPKFRAHGVHLLADVLETKTLDQIRAFVS